MKTFHERLFQLRKEANLTQSQLAEALNTSQRRISYIEKGRIEPDLETLVAIARYFGVTSDYLIGLDDY